MPPSASEPRARATEVTPHRAALDIAIQIGGQFVNLALGIVVTVILARSLGTDGYGKWATLLATVEIVAVVGNLGLEQVAVRYATREPEREGLWVAAATGLQIALALPVVVLFIAAVVLVAGGGQMLVAGLIFSVLFLTAAVSTLRVAFRIHIRNHIYILFLTANSVIWAAAVIAISAAGGGLVPFAIAFAATAVVVQGGMALAALRAVPVQWRGSTALWGTLARVGIAVGIAGALTFLYGKIDQLLIYELAPDKSEIGIYAAMYKILESSGAVPAAVMTTLFPILSGLYPSQPARLRRIMQAAFDFLAVVSFGALALTLVASGPIVALLYGPEYASGAAILPILFAGFVPICIGFVSGNMVIATDLQRRYIWFAALGLIVNLGLNLLLIPHFGIEGAAWVTLATELVVVGITTFTVLRKMEMRVSLRRILAAAVAATLAALAVLGLRELGLGAIPLVLAMAVFYPVALIALRALDLDEIRELIRARRQAPGDAG